MSDSIKSILYIWLHLIAINLKYSFLHFIAVETEAQIEFVAYLNYSSAKFPQWLNGKEAACQCRRCRFDPWVRRMPWRRKWQLAPVFGPGITKSWTWLSDLAAAAAATLNAVGCSSKGHIIFTISYQHPAQYGYLSFIKFLNVYCRVMSLDIHSKAS